MNEREPSPRLERLSSKINRVLRLYSTFPALPRTVQRLRTTLAITANLLLSSSSRITESQLSPLALTALEELIDGSITACIRALSERPLQGFLFGLAYMEHLRELDDKLVTILLRQLQLPPQPLGVLETLQEARQNLGDDLYIMDRYYEEDGAARTVDTWSRQWQQFGVVDNLNDCKQQLFAIQDIISDIERLNLSPREEARLKWIRRLTLDIVGDAVNDSQRACILQEIFAADSVDDFLSIYEKRDFADLKGRLRKDQNRYAGDQCVWAQAFVEQFFWYEGDDDIVDLHKDYRVLRCYLWELYQRCHSPRNSHVTEERIRRRLKVQKIDNILPLILALDRAYVLQIERRHWVSATDVQQSATWRARLVAAGQRVTIDQRYVWLVGLTDSNMAGLLTPTERPRQQEVAAAVVVDADVLPES